MSDLSDEQLRAIDRVIELYESGRKYISFAGKAGTGKTHVFSRLGTILPAQTAIREVFPLTTTGRAKYVLSRRTQQEVQTAYAFLYGRPDEEKVPVTDIDGNIIYEDDDNLFPKMMRTGKIIFGDPRRDLPSNSLYGIDESSLLAREPVFDDFMEVMPSKSLLMSIGDRNQLPAVGGDPIPGFRKEDTPDIELTEIHRQARDNPIIRIADKISRGIDMPYAWEYSDLTETASGDLHAASEWLADLIRRDEDATLITGTHKTRQKLNGRVRKLLQLDHDLVVERDRMVALRNDHERGLMNGETFHVERVAEIDLGKMFGLCFAVWRPNDPIPMIVQAGTIGAKSERWAAFTDILYARYRKSNSNGMMDLHKVCGQLNDMGFSYSARKLNPEYLSHVEATEVMRKLFTWLDYGWCLTVHKAQGSEWPHVGYFRDDWISKWMDQDSRQRFDYTALTRTSNYVRVFV